MNKHYICSVNFYISCAEKSLQSRIVRRSPALRFYYHSVDINKMVQCFRDLSYFSLSSIALKISCIT